ncbi:apolipoprotein N-acyltransferase [Duganella sp. CF458]|uniref:apolipoprotein N-acyltransferase n=1 Tax=Duganella sp. CF458 TaxID=1884368 RepID=UPI0008DF2529|nr:apolipoprotein N-acyltransferase [Duganella sp. CF458]SFG11053.1 apolipoprotein N-acyltransferase [Duganella sp. CF458]
MKILASVLASAAMTALYARGGAGWVLGFVLLVPWLIALDGRRSVAGTLLCAWAMSLAYTAAGFAWFGAALGRYTQLGEGTGMALLLLAAPLFQPQFFAYALVRYALAPWYGRGARALAAAAAWIALEWLVPRMLGDTLGYGLYPSRLLRQAADVGGTAGLTLLLLLANEGVAAGLVRYREGWRSFAKPLALAALAPAVLAAYGAVALSGIPAPAGKPLRMALIQANLVDYERQRQEKGAHAVVREVLDRHFAMGYDAVTRQRAEALLWSETAYPTTFGKPKSNSGAEFDREIADYVNAAAVPLVFGTYDRDDRGEYNAAAFMQPGRGLVGMYRKSHLFPFTEYLPAWLDGQLVRRILPWAGNWVAGSGARVFPLRLADGREIPVLPLICRDDVDTGLAVAGARLGGQVILTMSNDSWFSGDGPGARLHQAAAAFRSIETRLPQFRVTSNGFSAAIDASGDILAGTKVGEPALVIADLPVRSPVPTLVVLWGDWVGLACCALLLVLTVRPLSQAWQPQGEGAKARVPQPAFPMRVAVLPPAARIVAGLLRVISRAGLLGMCVALLLNEPLRTNTLAQLRIFGLFFLVPEAIAWLVLRAFSAQASVSEGRLVLARGRQKLMLGLAELAAIEPWRLPVPGPGVALRLRSGRSPGYGLALADPAAFSAALAVHGGPPAAKASGWRMLVAPATRLDHPLVKFVLLPLALALPAFHLHQHIAYGSALGEFYSFGLAAYLGAFGLWWAAWTIGVVLGAALVRTVIESATMLVALLRPRAAIDARQGLERIGHAALYLALPGWLLFRVFGA